MKMWRVSGLSRKHIKAEIQAGGEHPTLFESSFSCPHFHLKETFLVSVCSYVSMCC